MRRTLIPVSCVILTAGLFAGCGPNAADSGKPEAAGPVKPAGTAATATTPAPEPAPAKRPEPVAVKAPEAAPARSPGPVAAERPEPAKLPETPAAAAGASVTVKITVSDTGKPPAGARVMAICGDRRIDVPVGADGVAVASGLGKGVWSFNVSAPGCYGVVGAVKVDPAAAKSYEMPVKLDREEKAETPADKAAPAGK